MSLSQNKSRIGEVWSRLIGCFGGDAVERKFGKTVPPEWISIIGRLTDPQIDRGLRRLVYGGKAGVPSLPEFVKLCRTVGNDEFDEPASVEALPAPEDKFTPLQRAGNQRLWNHVMAGVKERRYYDERATRILLAWRDAWIRDVGEGNLDAATGELTVPSTPEQDAAWQDCMQRAEEAIRQKAAA